MVVEFRVPFPAVIILALWPVSAQQHQSVVWSEQEKPILEQIRELRGLPDDQRAFTTRNLALEIRQLPAAPNKLRLASTLADLSTEGDFGRETLEQVAAALADTLRQQPGSEDDYTTLAQLARYEHVAVNMDSPQLRAAMERLEASDRKRASADFTLNDLHGKSWSLTELHGKVVLVNFWATWCPPCRKEMPDLEKLYTRFPGRGLVVLGISDEDQAKVEPFIEKGQFTFPVLLDPGGKAQEAFDVGGIPKSFVFDRQGALVAQAIDMRTEKQFLVMLGQAGLAVESVSRRSTQ
jgi:peroxiredoxin